MIRARYFDPASRTIGEVDLDASDEALARELLLSQGRQWLSGGPAASSTFRFWLARSKSGSPRQHPRRDAGVFCREVRSLVVAGLSVVEALEALAEQAGAHVRRGERSDLYPALLSRLQAGRSLSAAMSDVGGFPLLLVASVQASERTSNLPQALSAYMRFDDLMTGLGRRVVSAALYPGIVLTLGLLIASFLLVVVMPRFAALYAQMGPAVGGVTRWLIGSSRLLRDMPWLPMALTGVAALLAWGLFGQGRWRRTAWHALEALPPLHRRWRQLELARFYEALALLVGGGYSLHEALTLCAQLGTHAAGQPPALLAQAAVARGQSASSAFEAAGLTDAVSLRLLRSGERGGDFAAVLHAIASRHAERFETFVERATRLVEPILLLGVALLVGGMVTMLYMPIFDIAASVR